MAGSRSRHVSSFTIIKGALIPETYAAFQNWDLSLSRTENLKRLKENNTIGATSANWLRDVAKVLNRRFEPKERDRSLIELARADCELETWKPLLLWHMTRDEFLVRDFLVHWLFAASEEQRHNLRSEDVLQYLASLPQKGVQGGQGWTDNTCKRVAAGLLKLAADFGLLDGTVSKKFAAYHLPETSFLYLLYTLAATQPNARKIIDSPDWRMYLMYPDDVERELLRLHQFRRIEYEVAGSLAQLKLPHASCAEYVKELVA